MCRDEDTTIRVTFKEPFTIQSTIMFANCNANKFVISMSLSHTGGLLFVTKSNVIS